MNVANSTYEIWKQQYTHWKTTSDPVSRVWWQHMPFGQAGLVRICGSRGNVIGSGAPWGHRGLIVTNAHVARRGEGGRMRVDVCDGSAHSAELVAADDRIDIAVLRCIGAVSVPAFPLGDSEALTPGDIVTAHGYPWGQNSAATVGVVVDARDVFVEEVDRGKEWLALRAYLYPGYSGGPVVDGQGRLVGICARTGQPGVGMAVPVHVVEELIEEVRA